MNFRSIFQAQVAVLTWPVKQIFVTERRMGTVTRKETLVLITPAVLVAMLLLLLRDVMASLELLPAAYRFQLDRNANGGWPLQRWPKACQTLMILYPAFFFHIRADSQLYCILVGRPRVSRALRLSNCHLRRTADSNPLCPCLRACCWFLYFCPVSL